MATINIYCLASVLSIIEAIWSFSIGIYFLIWKLNYSTTVFNEFILVFFIEAFLYIGVFVGLRKRRPKFFLPYLIGEIIFICCMAYFAYAPLLLLIVVNGIMGNKTQGEIFLIFLPGMFSIFCYVIILKAYRKMKREIFEQLPSVVFEFREDGRVAVIKDGTEVKE